jgi:hypothetical protein
MKTNNNKILGNYLNKPVYRINSKFNEGEYYINFNNVNYTLPKWKQNNPSLRDAIECIHYKMELDDNINDNDLIHLKNGLNKKLLILKIILIIKIKLKNIKLNYNKKMKN